MDNNPVWAIKYRPRTVAETILPEDVKKTFQAMVDRREIPVNLILAGPPGVGKTTVATAMLDELGYDTYMINGSLKTGIDTLRNDIMEFASAVSFTSDRKFVILDEADYLNPQSTQPALRNFMEEFSGNCGFILTCNYKNRIIEPLHSRCSMVEFRIPRAAIPQLAMAFMAMVCRILDTEGVTYDKAVVAEVIKRYHPDWRRVLNELQRYSISNGAIDSGILSRFDDKEMKTLVSFMRDKHFTSIRKWVAESADVDQNVLFRRFYEAASTHFTEDSVPQLVLLIAEYQYKAAFVADQEVNMAAFLVHVMAACQFK